MEITRANFQQALPQIENTINRCVFMAIDGEFTGLSSTGLDRVVSPFDTLTEYYSKIKRGSMNFLFIQFGLVAFMYHEGENKYTHRAYNFYLFPKPLLKQAPDCRFLCQASSIDFLASHGFDFNKLFNDGIPYLNTDDEEFMRTKLEIAREKRKFTGEKNNSFVECPAEHQDSVRQAFNLIVDFLSQNEGETELLLPPVNGFVRKLIYQEVWKRFSSNDLRIETKNGVMVVKRPATKEEKVEEEKQKFEEEESDMAEAVGFSNIVRLISQSRKLIVGHNMLLDLCHIIHRFCTPLPETYQEFKEVLHRVFPYILDTKFMCSCPPLSDVVPTSVLAHLLTTVSHPPFHLLKVEPEGRNAYSTLEEKAHEAGFDAYVSGTIAIALSDYLARHSQVTTNMRLPSAQASYLSGVINRLYLMRVKDSYMDLEKDDPQPNREFVFHVTFPEEWRVSDLMKMFNPFGGVRIAWISSKTAYCGLYNKTQVGNVIRRLIPAPPPGVSITTYNAFNNLSHPHPQRTVPEDNIKHRPKLILNKEAGGETIPEKPVKSDNICISMFKSFFSVIKSYLKRKVTQH